MKTIKLSKFEEDLRKGIFAFSPSLDRHMRGKSSKRRKIKKSNSLLRKKLPVLGSSTTPSTPKSRGQRIVINFLEKSAFAKTTQNNKFRLKTPRKKNSHHFSKVKINPISMKSCKGKKSSKSCLKKILFVKSENLVVKKKRSRRLIHDKVKSSRLEF